MKFTLKKPVTVANAATPSINDLDFAVEKETLPISKDAAVSPNQQMDLGSVIDKLVGGEGETAVAGIMELTHADGDIAMKANIPFAGTFTAAQIIADYNDYLFGEDSKPARMLRAICNWQYQHGCSIKGKRAEQAFNAYTQQVQQEFLLEKETKGILKR